MKRLMSWLFGFNKKTEAVANRAKQERSLENTLRRMAEGRGTFVVRPLRELSDAERRRGPDASHTLRPASVEEREQFQRLLESFARESRAGRVVKMPNNGIRRQRARAW